MFKTKECRYTRTYSELKGLQKSRTLIYTVVATPDGALISLEQRGEDGVNSEHCLCPSLSLTVARRLLRYAYENSFGLGCWLDMLEDLSVPYIRMPQSVVAEA